MKIPHEPQLNRADNCHSLVLEIYNPEGCLVKKLCIPDTQWVHCNHNLEFGCYFFRLFHGEFEQERGVIRVEF
jgi:hypothetical protein